MRVLRRLIGLVLVLSFFIVLPTAMWLFNVQRIVLDTSTYDNLFKGENFYEQLAPRVLPALIEGYDDGAVQPGELELRDVITALPDDEWEELVRRTGLVPVEWVEAEVSRNNDAFFGWLDGDTDELELVFHTDRIRQNLRGGPGDAMVRSIAERLPPCSAAESQQVRRFLDGAADADFPYCMPDTTALQTRVEAAIAAARAEAVAEIPREMDVLAEMEAAEAGSRPGPNDDPFTRSDLNQFRASVRLGKGLAPLNLLVPAALLSLIVIVAVRSSKSFFRWIGWSLLIGGLVALLPLFFLPLLDHALSAETELEAGFASAGEFIGEIVGQRLVRLLIGAFTWPVLLQASAVVVVGFVCVVVSVLLNDPDDPLMQTAPLAASPATRLTGTATRSQAATGTRPVPDSEGPTHLDENTPSAPRTPPPTPPGA